MKTTFPLIALRVLAGITVSASLLASTSAQIPAPVNPATPAATPAPKPLSPTDKNFIKNAGNSLSYLTQLVAEGKHPAAGDEKMVKFRSKLTGELKKSWDGLNTVAAQRGETITGELSATDKTTVEKLGKMKEDKFLKEWLGEMAKEAKKLDKTFESASRTVQDPELKLYVANYTPFIRTIFASVESQENSVKKK